MCLSDLWSDARREEWLRDKPEQIQAFKVVLVADQRAYPLFGPLPDPGFFQKTNDQTNHIPCQRTVYNYDDEVYDAYDTHFHMFPNREDAEAYWSTFWRDPEYIVLECRVPKEHITAMGLDSGLLAIVTKYFEFVERDHLFRDRLLDEPEETRAETNA